MGKLLSLTGAFIDTKVAVMSANVAAAGVFAFFWLSQVAISLLTLLIIIDTVTGFTKAWINWDATSKHGSRGIIAKVYLLLIPICISSVWMIAWLDLSSLTSWTLSLLAFAELYSIVANIYEIKTKKQLPEYDAVSAVIGGLLNVIKKILNNNAK